MTMMKRKMKKAVPLLRSRKSRLWFHCYSLPHHLVSIDAVILFVRIY